MMPFQKLKHRQVRRRRALRTLEFEAIGTRWCIDILQDITPLLWTELSDSIRARIDRFDRDYSRFREDSLITEMSRSSGDYTLPTDAQPMFDLYRELYEISNGSVTPMIGNTLADAGYDAQYTFRSRKLHTPPSWDDALRYEYPTLTIQTPVLLDFGAAGKGYIIDIVAAIIRDASVKSYCVEAGGDLVYQHEQGIPMRVGLEHPRDAKKVIGVVDISNKSIAGSAGNRRRWGNYHHIIDPASLTSPEHIMAVWTMADTAMIADAMSTALYFVPVEILKKRYNFEYLIMYPDSTVTHSDGFTHELY